MVTLRTYSSSDNVQEMKADDAVEGKFQLRRNSLKCYLKIKILYCLIKRTKVIHSDKIDIITTSKYEGHLMLPCNK